MDDTPTPGPQHDVTYYVLDRFEDGGWAALEQGDGQTFLVPRFWLPETAREGDALAVHKLPDLSRYGLEDDPSVTLDIYVDEDETTKRNLATRSLRDSLPRGPEGDLEL